MKLSEKKKYDVIGIENALVDILVHVTDDDIISLGLRKGVMNLVDQTEQDHILASVENHSPEIEVGGSASNVLRGAAVLGAKTLYSSALGNDEWGSRFKSRLKSLNIIDKTVIKSSTKSGSSVVLITPDAERTMNTFLGASREYDVEDLPLEDISDCKIFFSTGYMWDTDNQISAIEQAVTLAKKSGAVFAFDLADPFVVDRAGKRFRELMDNGIIDILFANAEEARMLTGHHGEKAARIIAKSVKLVAVKDGANGSYVAYGENISHIPVSPANPVDTTGAGDMYAGGFLFGLINGQTYENCARIGSVLAADNISRIGVRLSENIKDRLIKELPEIADLFR